MNRFSCSTVVRSIMDSAETDTMLSKKRKAEVGSANDNNGTSTSDISVFKGFKVKRVLNDIPQRKTIFLQGEFENDCDHVDKRDGDAVVILEKTPFSEQNVQQILNEESEFKLEMKNDIYNTLQLYPPAHLNGIKTTLIYPATKKHIAKYESQKMFLLEENPEDYQAITLPHINSQNFSIQWVYNILEKKSEADRIVFEDADPETGFILLPDMKWDGRQTEDLYLVAISQQRGIKSLRDLNASHLPLLKNIQQKSKDVLKEKYGVPSSKLRLYLHYQPSYYHLHVHINHLQYDAPGSGCERGHLLTDVIDNLQFSSDFYARKTLTFVVKSSDTLYQKYNDAGKV